MGPGIMKRYVSSASLVLVCGFLATIAFFQYVDVYHQHFFTRGTLPIAYNVMRLVFACYLGWMVYYLGYAVLVGLKCAPPDTTTVLERAVIGFGTGLGTAHVVLLALGLASLYYAPLLILLCVFVLIASAPQASRAFLFVRALRFQNAASIWGLCGAVIAVAGLWLFAVKGLYPGGGHDYFTHYFYYYLEVIHNHGLQPNDVWYHYYYSKGAGLIFLAMVLTDPVAPAIATFCYVFMAGVALSVLCARLTPHSLWPALCGGLYFVWYCLPLGSGTPFELTHEETSALIVLTTWALCMRMIGPAGWKRPLFVMCVGTLIATGIIDDAAAIISGLVLALGGLVAFAIGKRKNALALVLLSVVSGAAAFATLAIGYIATGLASDQPLDVMLRFANLDKLAQWGVIPQIIMVEWIRDNYAASAPALSLGAVAQELSDFLRLEYLWLLLATGLSAVTIGLYRWRFASGDAVRVRDASTKVVLLLGFVILALALISIPAAGSQTVSFLRFSSFFVPLLILCSCCCWGVLAASLQRRSTLVSVVLPCLLFFGVVACWQVQHSALSRGAAGARTTARYIAGFDSLADAYALVGGISVAAAEIMNQAHIPPGARLWSTNVQTTCMIPGCVVESVASFKMSSRLNEILNGSPQLARQILQQEKLNYFIFSKEAGLLDVLPYSQLFAPQTIGDYLGVQWTNGSDFLLTWRGPGVRPLDANFMRLYVAALAAPESSWFRFRELLPYMNSTMEALESTPHPWRTLRFTWRTHS